MKKLSIKTLAILVFAFLFLGAVLFAQPLGPLAIKDKLDEEWQKGEQSRAVFRFRQSAQGIYNALQNTIAEMDEIVAGGNFGGVDPEIKQEGQEIRNELKALRTALEDNQDFINWMQP